MRLGRIATCAWVFCVLATGARAATDEESANANSANNPVEPRLTVQYWNYYAPSLGYVNGDSENGIMRNLVPFKIAGIQQIFHIDPTIVSNPTAKSGPRTGVGGLQIYNFSIGQFDLGLPQKVILGFGPVVIAPTRSNTNFGTDRWQAGAGGVINTPQSWGILGALATYQHTVSGPKSAVFEVQPFVYYNLPRGFYLRSSAIMEFNGANQTAVIPIGLGLGKVIQLDGGYTLNVYAEGQPSVYRTGVGAPNYQVFTGIQLQLPVAVTANWNFF